MDIEILSVKNKDNYYELKERHTEICDKLAANGFSLTYFNSVDLKPKSLLKALNESASNNSEKPEIVIIANALSSHGSKSFKKYF